jgi:hypothetical protein
MSKRTNILTENYTIYPNELIRNPNNIMTKNERNLMIFLWDRLYGFEYPNNELSYSVIIRHCKDIPKNNAKLSDAIKGLERKGLLKVFRTTRNTNKYFIGEKQVKILQWYGKNFKGWKDGIIEPPEEITENETENDNEPQEKTLFEEIIECEFIDKRKRFIEPIPTETTNEKMYLYQLTENEFKDSYPDMNIACLTMYRNQTIENFNKTAESIRKRRKEQQEQKENPKPAETDTPTEPTENEEPEMLSVSY